MCEQGLKCLAIRKRDLTSLSKTCIIFSPCYHIYWHKKERSCFPIDAHHKNASLIASDPSQRCLCVFAELPVSARVVDNVTPTAILCPGISAFETSKQVLLVTRMALAVSAANKNGLVFAVTSVQWGRWGKNGYRPVLERRCPSSLYWSGYGSYFRRCYSQEIRIFHHIRLRRL